MSNKENFIQRFREVKALGYQISSRRGNTGIGKTFEDLMGVIENNDQEPDLFGFEIKSQRQEAQSYVTLFTKSPTNPRGANGMLRLSFGTTDSKFAELKVLHASIFCHREVQHKGGFTYTLNCKDDERKLYLIVKDTSTGEIVSSDVYWSYDVLEATLTNKLKNLAMVQARTETDNEQEYFYFDKCTLYTEPSFDKFLEMLKAGEIMFDIRIGSYKNPEKSSYGKTHDHGSCFRIKENKIKCLYDNSEDLE